MAAFTGALIAAGAGLAGSAIAANGQKKAAQGAAAASERATQATIAEQRRQFDLIRQDQAPWQAAGKNALANLQNPLASFEASPDYQFRMTNGLDNLNSAFAAGAGNGLKSGAAVKALEEFRQNTASGEFGNYWNRQSGLAGVGQTANNAVGQAGQSMANNIGNALTNNANTLGSSYLAQGQANANMIGGLTNALGYAAGNFNWGGGAKAYPNGYQPPAPGVWGLY